MEFLAITALSILQDFNRFLSSWLEVLLFALEATLDVDLGQGLYQMRPRPETIDPQSTLSNWGAWIAFAALLAGLGKFLDDHHIRSSTKSGIRLKLVSCFVWLDETKVPNPAEGVVRLLAFAVSNKLVASLVALSLSYWLAASLFWWWRSESGREPEEGYLMYVIDWLEIRSGSTQWVLYMGTILVSALVGCVAVALTLTLARKTESIWKRALTTSIGLAVGVLGATMVCHALLHDHASYSAGLPQLASGLLPLFLAILSLLLMAAQGAITLTKNIALKVFDAASSPAASPFTYASSLTGALILCAKLAQEILR